MDEKILIFKISRILGISEDKVQFDLPYVRIIEKLVNEFEKLADENKISIYE
jgi:hypothetical protein